MNTANFGQAPAPPTLSRCKNRDSNKIPNRQKRAIRTPARPESEA
jgi:hypothetical protein